MFPIHFTLAWVHTQLCHKLHLLLDPDFFFFLNWLSTHYIRSSIQLNIQPHLSLMAAEEGNKDHPLWRNTYHCNKSKPTQVVFFFLRLWQLHAILYLPSQTSSFHMHNAGADSPEHAKTHMYISLPRRGGTTMHAHTLEIPSFLHEYRQTASSWWLLRSGRSRHVWVCTPTVSYCLSGRSWRQMLRMVQCLFKKQAK